MQALRKRLTGHMLWEYPDLGIITLGVFVVYMGLGTIWPVLTLYMQAQGIGIAEIGVTTAAYMASNFLFQIPMGWASDRIGRKPLLLAGLAVHGVISIMYLPVHGLLGFAILRFIEGIGASAMMPAARAHIMDSIPAARRGQAFGLLGAAVNGGILIGPAVGGLMAGVTGMEGPFWFGAGSSLLAGIFLAFLVKARRTTEVEPAGAASEAAGISAEHIQWRAILPVFISTIGWGFVGGFFNVVWNIWIHDLGGSLDIIGLSYTVFALPLIILGPWAGRLSDRHNRVLLILAPSLVAGAIYIAYGFLTNLWIIMVLGTLEGAMIALLVPASDSYLADVMPSSMRGRVQGMVTTTNTAMGFIGALICGPLYAIGPLYLFLVLGALHIITATTASVLMMPTERRLHGHKVQAAAAQARKDAPRVLAEAEAI
jgi:MFS family permease